MTAQVITRSERGRTLFHQPPAGIQAEVGGPAGFAGGADGLVSLGVSGFPLQGGSVLPYRLTFAIVKVDGQWLIAQHHGSPLPK